MKNGFKVNMDQLNAFNLLYIPIPLSLLPVLMHSWTYCIMKLIWETNYSLQRLPKRCLKDAADDAYSNQSIKGLVYE